MRTPASLQKHCSWTSSSPNHIKMGLYTAAVVTPIIVVGVLVGSPAILGFIGLGAVGATAGGGFALAQASTGAIAAGSWMAAAQTIAMTAVSPTS